MTALARLGLDFTRIAGKRWLKADMERAFRFGRLETDPTVAFCPLRWLADPSGGYKYTFTMYRPPEGTAS